jgi:hypothetical protein
MGKNSFVVITNQKFSHHFDHAPKKFKIASAAKKVINIEKLQA